MVTVALEPSIEVGDVTAVYVTTTLESPGPPISGLDWVNPWAKANHITLLQLKVPNAVSQTGDLVQPLSLGAAAARAGGYDKLSSALNQVHLSEARHSGAIKGAIGSFIGGFEVFPPLGLVGGFATAVGHLTDLGESQLADVSFPEQPLGQVNELDGYFQIETFAGNTWKPAGRVGDLFFPRGTYTALEVKVAEYDPSSKTLGPGDTVRCPWRLEGGQN